MPDRQVITIIPARVDSSRFPRKLLQDRTGKPLIRHTVELAQKAMVSADLPAEVWVATDSKEIAEAVEGYTHVCMTGDALNGTDRVGEGAVRCRKESVIGADDHRIVGFQADEPSVNIMALKAFFESVHHDLRHDEVFTMEAELGLKDIQNRHVVKVIHTAPGLRQKAHFFTRVLDTEAIYRARVGSHVGVYAYTFRTLMRYYQATPTDLELAESLEQMRWLDMGIPIYVQYSSGSFPGGIDTPEDYEAFIERQRSK